MKNFLRDLPAWGISLVINLTILFALNLIVQSVDSLSFNRTIETALEEQIIEEEYQFVETAKDTVGNMGDTNNMTAVRQVATTFGPANDVPIERRAEVILNPTKFQMQQVPMIDTTRSPLVEKFDSKGTTSSEVVQGGMDGVMDRTTLEIRRSLEERQTHVIWLFDASGSLSERRQGIADRFETVYKQLDKLNASAGLYTTVASYGEGAALLTPQPVEGTDVKELVKAVRGIKEDTSGKENVFRALNLCIDKFKTFSPGKRRTNRLVFIVTDERGDDWQLIEDTINLAKTFHFRVFCVGNGSVFGQRQGYVRWRYEDGFEEDIAVDQGPESAFPMTVQLPYWGSGGDWRLSQMSAGFGPYTLTRLCAETGGMYLLTEEARGYQFDQAQMRKYAPDYRPVRVIQAEIQKNPAKAALVQAANFTYEDSGIPTPETVFRGYNDTILRQDLTEAQKPVAVINYKLEQLHRLLEAGSSARNSLIEPRWRASYDLAMGRVLAMRVRLEGYNRMLAQMSATPKSFENPENNEWRLVPSAEIETGPVMRKAAEQAREYLKRVIDEHPGTPWALMAERELSADLGWAWAESQRPLPGMQNAGNLSPEERVQLLLAEDERREQERRRQREKPRDKPKL